jgi:hypothetical protein
MAQTILTVVMEVRPESVELLRDRITDLDRDARKSQYRDLIGALPALHFMAMTVFADDDYDPVFVLEANFDGKPGPFFGQLEGAIGPRLRDMLRCCKAPRDQTSALFAAVTAPGSVMPVAPLLEARSVWPAIFHQGNRGLDRARIEREGALFLAVRNALGKPAAFQGMTAQQIHEKVRAFLLPDFAWLAEPAESRIPTAESIADWLRLIAFAFAALMLLHLPGLLLPRLIGVRPALVLVLLALIVLAAAARRSWRASAPDPDLRAATRGGLDPVQVRNALMAVTIFLAALLGLCVGVAWLAGATVSPALLLRCAAYVAIAVLGAIAIVLAILIWLRWLETRDPAWDTSPDAAATKRINAILAREDRITQNHMGSVVHVKPGVLRAVLVRAGLWGLGLLLRVKARNGYLSNMRTIHFAHWALIGNGGALMFFSNFDGSWESYLDDFIEKAHAGLTLAWSCGVGFPSTRFLVLEGATNGRRFKEWARHSMAENLFWCSAYPQFTVNQIERHARIADGLRKPRLSAKQAEAWALDL